MTAKMVPVDDGLKQFTEYFVQNYPGPGTIISRPEWHAPKIFRAAMMAYHDARSLAAPVAPLEPMSAAPDAASAQKCAGYPDCDGDLIAEPHEPDCPAAPASAPVTEEVAVPYRFTVREALQRLVDLKEMKRRIERGSLGDSTYYEANKEQAWTDAEQALGRAISPAPGPASELDCVNKLVTIMLKSAGLLDDAFDRFQDRTHAQKVKTVKKVARELRDEATSLSASAIECRGEEVAWIPVSERLPDNDLPVAVTGPTIEGNAAIANFMGDMWLVQSGTPDMGAIDITHWCDCIPALPVLK